MHKLEVNRRIRNYPPAEDPMTFDASMCNGRRYTDTYRRTMNVSWTFRDALQMCHGLSKDSTA